MTTSFDLFNLHPSLVQAIAQCGYTEPTPIQTAVIPHLLVGDDVIGQAQTGTGKTAAFALPMLHNLLPGHGAVQALVLTPTRELALQVAGSIADYGQFSGARVLAVYGGAAYGPQIGGLKRGADIVVGTPGRLMDLMEKGVLHLDKRTKCSAWAFLRRSNRSSARPPLSARQPSFQPPCRLPSAAWLPAI